MSAVKACYEVTEKLFQLVIHPPADRDEAVAAIEELLEKRQALLAGIQPPFKEEEQRLGREMVERNAVIDSQLRKLKEAIQKDMQGLTKKKDSVNKYVNPYASMQLDGVFYDKKN
ncbi:flagellar protein FliT [Bacillus aerolatus]|uniref:Flagellar protein FliT n=1 Tax=Bacillus aerolatus TaxID=2653354 RepID=A0A6I1FUV4_9BACI|nr:flagellar protein FliT [Bacillus aerolatus]KAB7706503.1 flagellar protein FliT [Bacillus aerolatus]